MSGIFVNIGSLQRYGGRIGSLSRRIVNQVSAGLSLNGAAITDLTAAIGLTSNSTITGGGGQTYILSGVISGGFSLTFSLDPGTTVILTAANTWSGGCTINSGTVQVGNGGTVGSIASAPTVNAGGTLAYFRSDGAGNPTVSGAGTVSLLGTGVTNQGAYVWSNANTGFTGSLIIGGGSRLRPLNASALGSAAVTVQSGAQLYLSQGYTLSNNLTLAGTGWNADGIGAIRFQNTGNVMTGTVTLSGNTLIGNEGAGIISGVISGAFNLEKNGTNTLTLSGVNTYSGTTTISAGTLAATGSSNNSAHSIGGSAGISAGTTTTGSVDGLTFAAATSVLTVNPITTSSASKLTCAALTAASGFRVNVSGAMNAGTYPILVSSSGTPTPTLGTNSSGRTVSFSWSGQTLNMTLV